MRPVITAPKLDGVTADPVRPDEAALLLLLARAFHIEDGHPMDEAAEAATLAAITGEDDAALAPTFLLRLLGTVIGYFVLSFGYSPEHGGRDAFIDDFFLMPEARGQGLGHAALDCAIEAAAACGARVVLLEVDEHNDRAYYLYQRHGFTDTNRRLLRRDLPQPD